MLKSKSQIFFKNSFKYHSTLNHSRVVIVGGGTGGLSVANQLVNLGVIKSSEITIIDPETIHYYQPGFTKLGGGVIENNSFNDKFIRYQMDHLTKNFKFQNSRVTKFNPDNNSVLTSNDKEFFYDHLIIAAGLQVNFENTPGLKALLDNEESNVCSIYNYKYAVKTAELRKRFTGGKVLFTQPPAPIKCAGAPQKMMYLCEREWKKRGINSEVHFTTPLKQIFGVTYYSESLSKIAEGRGYNIHFQTVLTSVEKDKAIFQNQATKENIEINYDFLHVVPLMSAPSFLKGSPVADQSGFVDVGFDLRHKKYSNIWGIGDCVSLPNAKTAAAIFSQAPVLASNLANDLVYAKKSHLNEEQQKCPFLNPEKKADVNFPKRQTALYDGYSACPLFIGGKKLMLGEFRTYFDVAKNENVTVPDESFGKGKQTVPRTLYFYLTKSFLLTYKLGIYGRWYGKNGYLNPVDKTGKVNDLRKKAILLTSGIAFTSFIINPAIGIALTAFGVMSLIIY